MYLQLNLKFFHYFFSFVCKYAYLFLQSLHVSFSLYICSEHLLQYIILKYILHGSATIKNNLLLYLQYIYCVIYIEFILAIKCNSAELFIYFINTIHLKSNQCAEILIDSWLNFSSCLSTFYLKSVKLFHYLSTLRDYLIFRTCH